jgi:hypothetical protein
VSPISILALPSRVPGAACPNDFCATVLSSCILSRRQDQLVKTMNLGRILYLVRFCAIVSLPLSFLFCLFASFIPPFCCAFIPLFFPLQCLGSDGHSLCVLPAVHLSSWAIYCSYGTCTLARQCHSPHRVPRGFVHILRYPLGEQWYPGGPVPAHQRTAAPYAHLMTLLKGELSFGGC